MLTMRFLDFDDPPWTRPTRHISIGDSTPIDFDFIPVPATTTPFNIEAAELIVSNALMSEEGRLALAMSMTEPIKISLEYQAIGRKLLMIDELGSGALARYEMDVAVKDYVVPKYWPSFTSVQRGKLRFLDVVEEIEC